MKMSIFPLASVLACTLGFASQAEASGYAISLDNYGTGGVPTWAGTGGTITIKTKINGVWATVCELHPTSRSGGHWCYASNVFDWDDVDGIWIETDSSDGFWLDQFHLWESTGPLTYQLRRTWGADNNTGWCFSTGSENASQHCINSWWSALVWNL